MSKPREVLPGTTYFLTRRCSERRFFLRPDGTLMRAFLFVLAYAARRYGVLIHAVCVMSNHWHAVVTDTRGELPRFAARVHLLVAKLGNCFRGRWEAFWDDSPYSAIPLVTADDVIDKIVYTLVNPVAAGLVRDIDDWPGLLLGPHNGLGKSYSADRPSFFFSRRSRTVPDSASTCVAKPPQLAEAADEEFVRVVNQEANRRMASYRAEYARKEQKFLGTRRVLRQKWSARPRTCAPRRARKPRVAAKDTALRVRQIAAHQRFVEDYQRARDAWRRGRRRTTFPSGTYWMKRFHGVRCEPAPT